LVCGYNIYVSDGPLRTTSPRTFPPPAIKRIGSSYFVCYICGWIRRRGGRNLQTSPCSAMYWFMITEKYHKTTSEENVLLGVLRDFTYSQPRYDTDSLWSAFLSLSYYKLMLFRWDINIVNILSKRENIGGYLRVLIVTRGFVLIIVLGKNKWIEVE